MSVRILCLFTATVLWACSAPKGPNITLLVQKPTSADYSCVGVVGFEVTSTGAGKTVQSGAILNAAAVQIPEDCKLDRPFAIDGLNIDAPITVTVVGYDGAGNPRVRGTENIDNLNAATAPIVLQPAGNPPPYPLILDRGLLLKGIALSEVTSMTIATAKGQPQDLLVVDVNKAKPYFSVEPGGFGILNLAAQELTVAFTLNSGVNVAKQRVVTRLDNLVFRVQ